MEFCVSGDDGGLCLWGDQLKKKIRVLWLIAGQIIQFFVFGGF